MLGLGRNPGIRELTLTASLAAVYTIFRAIPISSLIGISGSITAAGMIAPVIGILLEPAYGVTAVFVGTTVASFLPWNPLKFYGLDFLPGALNVILVSLAVRGRRVEATMMFAVMLGLFFINPYTSTFVGGSYYSPPIPYLWMHLAAFLLLISPLSKGLAFRISSEKYTSLVRPVVVLAFMGTMIEHLTGGLLFATIVGKGALKFWPVIFLAYPVERIILVVGATIICTALLSLIRRDIVRRALETVSSVVPRSELNTADSG